MSKVFVNLNDEATNCVTLQDGVLQEQIYQIIWGSQFITLIRKISERPTRFFAKKQETLEFISAPEYIDVFLLFMILFFYKEVLWKVYITKIQLCS